MNTSKNYRLLALATLTTYSTSCVAPYSDSMADASSSESGYFRNQQVGSSMSSLEQMWASEARSVYNESHEGGDQIRRIISAKAYGSLIEKGHGWMAIHAEIESKDGQTREEGLTATVSNGRVYQDHKSAYHSLENYNNDYLPVSNRMDRDGAEALGQESMRQIYESKKAYADANPGSGSGVMLAAGAAVLGLAAGAAVLGAGASAISEGARSSSYSPQGYTNSNSPASPYEACVCTSDSSAGEVNEEGFNTVSFNSSRGSWRVTYRYGNSGYLMKGGGSLRGKTINVRFDNGRPASLKSSSGSGHVTVSSATKI